MALQTVAGHRIGEDTHDLELWLRALDGCPQVTHTAVLRCPSPAHTEEPASWFYIEADAVNGLLRRRCLSCGFVVATLDSESRWSHPRMWSCFTCGQSISEVVAGLHAPGEGVEPGPVTWVVFGVRCVGCGCVDGITDMVIPATAYADVLDRL